MRTTIAFAALLLAAVPAQSASFDAEMCRKTAALLDDWHKEKNGDYAESVDIFMRQCIKPRSCVRSRWEMNDEMTKAGNGSFMRAWNNIEEHCGAQK